MPGFIKSKIYIPVEDINEQCLIDNFQIHNFNEKACLKCAFNKDRPNEYCEACLAYEGILRLWNKGLYQGKAYYTIPSGNIKRAEKFTGIDFSTYQDLRCVEKFSVPLKWTGKLRQGEVVNGVPSANQVELVNTWLKPEKRYGFIQAAPRTGKTVCANYISMTLGLKTLIIAHQHELLVNFMDSLVRDTNLTELQEQTGRQIAKIMDSKKDLEKEDYDILLFTYQSFIREASDEDFKKYIKGKFGLVIVDEAHQAGASAYGKFLNKLDCRYRLGMSATPLRKDALNFVLLNIIGPTTVKSETTGLIPLIQVIETGIQLKKEYMNFSKNLSALQKEEKRNRILLREVVYDLKQHQCILIPVDSKAHMNALVDSINNYYGDKIAYGFWSGVKDRKNILKDIDAGKYRVVVAIKSIIKQGIDIKIPSMLYVQIQMSANPQPVGAPMFYQLSNRVCTPYSGKQQPIVKIFVDNVSQSYGCYVSLFSKEIKPGLMKPENGRPKYKMSEKAYLYSTSIVKRVAMKVYTQKGYFNPDKMDFTYNPEELEKKVKNKDIDKVSKIIKSGSWL